MEDLLLVLAGTAHPFSPLKTAVEFDYQEGRIDVVAATEAGKLFAFEAKLTRWRTALHQAYRNNSFAHYSYVVLPVSAAAKARRRSHEFEQRRVGLCSVSGLELKVEIPAPCLVPLRPWMTDRALRYIEAVNAVAGADQA